MDNVNLTTQSGAIWMRIVSGIRPYVWAGRKTQLGDISTPYGALTTTTAFDPRGGLYKDGTLNGSPAEVTTELTIKHEQHSRTRTELIGKFINIDKRSHIDGKDRDSAGKWIDIERIVSGRVTDRTTSATTSTDEEEAMITLPISAQDTIDIYRTRYASIVLTGLAAGLVAIDVATRITPTSNGIVYAVADVNVTHTNVNVLVNLDNGESAEWVVKELVGVVDAPIDIVGFGNFVGILFATNLLRSDTYGDAFSIVQPDGWTAMNGVFGLDQTAMFAVGDNGFISRSVDGGRTWEDSLQAGTVTTDNLSGGYVVDERVIYVYGASGVLLRSDDFGVGWYVIPTGTAENLLSVSAPNRREFVCLLGDGTILQSEDSGETVKLQATLEGLPADTYTNGVIEQLGADVYFMSISNGTTASFTYRNVDAGADGYWYVPNGIDTTAVLLDSVMMDNNTFIQVGGLTDNVIGSIR